MAYKGRPHKIKIQLGKVKEYRKIKKLLNHVTIIKIQGHLSMYSKQAK